MIGFDPESFWDQTLRTISIVMYGKLRADRHEYNKRVWLAWHTAAFQRAKKMPRLRSLLARDKPRAQSWQEQTMVMRSWASAHNAKLAERSDG